MSAWVFLSCSLWLSATTPAAPAFQALPDLSGGSTASTLSRISSNGLWAIGQSPSSNGPEAVRWSISANTALGLGDLTNSPFSSFGSDISNNGLFASGRGTPATGQVRMMRWVSGRTPPQFNLQTLASTGFAYSEARAISNDGTKLVGQSSSTSGLRAVLWTETNATNGVGTLTNLGAITLIPTSPAGNLTSYFSEANDISGDGLHIVGTSSYLNQQSVTDPDPTDNYTPPPTFRSSGSVGFIRQTTTLIQLSDLTGGAMAAGAHAISDDKTRVAGFGTSSSGTEGVIWNIGTTITVSSVGDLAGGATDCRLLGLNENGTRAVGKGTDADGSAAVIWNSEFGLQKLSTVLAERGIDVTGWNLTEANSISADGLVIGGNGINPSGVEQAWIITNADYLFLPVQPPPAITSFTASPAVIPPGGSSTLSWTTTNALTATIDSGVGDVAVNGSIQVVDSAAETKTYTLTATDNLGRQVTATTTVTINHAPDFPGFSTGTSFETSATLFFSSVLTGTTDPENDSFTITDAGPSSAHGGSVLLQADSILYTPADGHSGEDSFPITITDARGSSTVGMVTVTVDDDPSVGASPPTIAMLPDRKVQLEFQGIAGRFYEVQRSTNLQQWSVVATLLAGPTGLVIHVDNNPPQKSAFYRIAGVTTPNQPPVFPGFTTTTGFQTAVTLSFSSVLLGTTDPENDGFNITAADPVSVNGGTVLLQADSILYTPPAGYSGEDHFQVTITDARGSATNATLVVSVDENPATEAGTPTIAILSDGKPQLGYQGIAGRTYMIERSTNLAQWSVLETLVAGPSGLLEFTDDDPPQGSAFYRIRTP